MSGIDFSVVEVRESVENLSLDGLSVFIILLLKGGAASSWVVEHDDVDSISSSVLVETSLENVKQGFPVIVSQSVHSTNSGKESDESAQSDEFHNYFI